MIHSLVCKKLSLWLASTVDLWAGDVLEVAKLGTEEKKVKLPAVCKRKFGTRSQTRNLIGCRSVHGLCNQGRVKVANVMSEVLLCRNRFLFSAVCSI